MGSIILYIHTSKQPGCFSLLKLPRKAHGQSPAVSAEHAAAPQANSARPVSGRSADRLFWPCKRGVGPFVNEFWESTWKTQARVQPTRTSWQVNVYLGCSHSSEVQVVSFIVLGEKNDAHGIRAFLHICYVCVLYISFSNMNDVMIHPHHFTQRMIFSFLFTQPPAASWRRTPNVMNPRRNNAPWLDRTSTRTRCVGPSWPRTIRPV